MPTDIMQCTAAYLGTVLPPPVQKIINWTASEFFFQTWNWPNYGVWSLERVGEWALYKIVYMPLARRLKKMNCTQLIAW